MASLDVLTHSPRRRGYLELDLFRRPDGRAGVVDPDEWDLLVGSGLISDDAVRNVNETARTLLSLVEDRVEPFGDAALPRLRSLGTKALGSDT